MKENDLVSIIIPTYNRPEYLKKAIMSVLSQTYRNFEIIIVDDASEANNKKVITSFDNDRIYHIENNKQRGAPFSRNKGIKQANGKFIAFLDDDDEWEPTKLEKQIKEFENNDVGLVVCYSLDKRFNMTRVSKPSHVITYECLLKSFNLSSTSSYIVRKKILEKVGGFDTNLPSAQEYDLALRIAKNFEVRTVPEVLMIQNASDGQISTNWRKKISGIMAIHSKFGKEYRILGRKLGFFNHIKFIGVLTLFFFGYFLGSKIYKIIIPIKEIYENV
jgi:glycosyltransferase involved in cell wall biosynthesis